MENIPPSYEAAIARDPWKLIAPHIFSAELCALNRVNHDLHGVFAPFLWGNPASHFGTDGDRVYVALTRFKRTLRRVRLSVRELTHTLRLPPAQSEIYDGPRPEWLRDVLEQLPNLQSLIVSGLPFFDHNSLLCLRSYSNGRRPSLTQRTNPAIPTFALRLLIATDCQNTTSQGLAEALEHFPNISFLDLSRTLAARDRGVLSKLHDLPLLQSLKLRAVHLRDDDVDCLAQAIGIRVRSLDVSENALTDDSVRALLCHCFITRSKVGDNTPEIPQRASFNLALEDWPAGFVRPDSSMLDEFRDQSYDERFVRRLTSHVVSRLPFEDMPQSGITHLSIMDNHLSVEGLKLLFRSKRLHVLDAGSIDTAEVAGRPPISSFMKRDAAYTRSLDPGGVERLTPVLERCGHELTNLRIDHSLVTKDTPPEEDALPMAPCELSVTNPAVEVEAAVPAFVELEAAPPVYEIDSQEAMPRYELPGDSLRVTASPAIGHRTQLSAEERRIAAKRGSVFAPELAVKHEGDVGSNDEHDALPLLTATGLGQSAQTVNGIPVRPSDCGPDEEGHFLDVNGKNDLSISIVQRQRRDMRAREHDKPHGLLPGMLPALRSITLTSVPAYIVARRPLDALIRFIDSCASEHHLAELEAHLPSKSSQNGRDDHTRRIRDHHAHIGRAFALQSIVLEMAPDQPAPGIDDDSLVTPSAKMRSSARKSKAPVTRTFSSTEDADSEAFMSASRHDFTFFDDQEECGLPSKETDVDTHSPYSMSTMTEKMILVPPSSEGSSNESPNDPPKSRQQQRPPHQNSPSGHRPYHQKTPAKIDVIRELAQFRRDRKAAYEQQVGLTGCLGVYVPGYWPGEVKVVRNSQRITMTSLRGAGTGVGIASGTSTGESEDGRMDFYGNVHAGGIYR